MAENTPLNSKAKFTKSTTKESRRKDRLSALPDSLLLHILSSLDTKQVIRTCVLSKRWRFLWTDSSSFVLQETSGDVFRSSGFVYSLARILALCTGVHLKKLSIHFMYQHYFAASVNVWVEFAIRTRIKDFTLLFVTYTNEFYPLPQTLYSTSSLTDLTIGGCVIAPRGSIAWRFLKNLRIHNVVLDELVFEKIMIGCPVLELLQLTTCWGHGRLKVSSPNLTTLVIVGWTSYPYPYDYCLMISAPYLRVLSVSDEWPTRSFVVGDFWLSLVTAKVDYKFAFDAANFVHVDRMLLPTVKRSLESFSSVKELELGPWCIQVLSWLEKKSLHLSQSTRLCLTLNAWRHKSSIGGILNILKSSPNLETLVIKGINYENHLNFGSQLQDDSSDLVLCSLKTVNISGFSEAGLSGEPMLTLVQLLLKSATNLEKIVIDAKTLTSNSSTTHHFSEISLKLLGFPRSSPKAVVMIR